MDRNVILAIVLSLGIMLVWNVWYAHRYGDVLTANREEMVQQVEQPSASKQPVPLQTKESTATTQAKTAPLNPIVAPGEPLVMELTEAKQVAGELLVSVDTGVSVVTLSNVGGVITSWALSDYADDENQPIELVSAKADLKPLALEFSSKTATKKINRAVFNTSSEGKIVLSESNPTYIADFSLTLQTGFNIKKRITLHYNSYRADVAVSLSHPSKDITGSTFSIGWFGLGDNIASKYSYHGPVVYTQGKRLAEKPDVDEKKTYEGNIEWAGLISMYYCMAFFPENGQTVVNIAQPSKNVYSASVRLVSPGNDKPVRLALYAGPKAIKDLKKQGRKFQRIINYGWSDIIAKPLYTMLIWFYNLTGNFGVAIIVLTVIIKLLFFPLTQKSFRSMNKLRTIQPQMKILQERYKKDKPKLNEELIGLYKKHKVNPMSGCLPMILQIPVFIALYKVLLGSIELKGADFGFWIHDLSMKDPYYITPVFMGLLMFLQQKLSPQANDPMQRNMMMALPIVFTVMFLNFPAGLVIYWIVNNILSIAQQWYIKKEA